MVVTLMRERASVIVDRLVEAGARRFFRMHPVNVRLVAERLADQCGFTPMGTKNETEVLVLLKSDLGFDTLW